jgi:ABC-2 type transport system ATP-binding protein
VDEAPLAIAVRGLTKRYGALAALDGLDLAIEAGAVVGLVGNAGAGKTTALRLIAGLARPSGGEVVLTATGQQLRAGALAARRRTGYLDAEPAFYDWMTGRDLLRFVGGILGLADDELRSEIGDVVAVTGLEGHADRAIETYGVALRKRLGIAQAFLGHPGLVLLDEPFTGLDAEGAPALHALVSDVAGSATVLMASDDLEQAAELCDRLAILDGGRLIAEGDPGELVERASAVTYLIEVDPGEDPGIPLLVDALRRHAWVSSVDADAGHRVLRVRVRNHDLAAMRVVPLLGTSGMPIRRVERVTPNLDDLLTALLSEPDAIADDLRRGGAAAEAAS